jgi:peptidoglycan/xylan/chitin deacetylase (PgdA/CDA1 family)
MGNINIRRPSVDHFVHGLFLLGALFLLVSFLLVLVKQPTRQAFKHHEVRVSNTSFVNNYSVRYPALNRTKVDALIRSFAEKKVRTFEQKLANKNDTRNQLTTRFTLVHFGERVMSIAFTTEEKVVGLPDVMTTEHLTADLQEDRILTIHDIFLPAVRMQLAKLLYDYFKQQIALGLSPAELVNILDLTLDDLQEFSLESNGVEVFINPHQPSSATGKLGVMIEKPLLSDMLMEPYRVVEPDRGEVTKSTTPYRIAIKPPSGNTIDPKAKMIALTFDDGPSYLTPQLLDTLNKYEANATFFVLGKLAASQAGILQREIAEGNEIGNHSWGHPMLTQLSAAGIDYQITATQTAVQAATGGYTPMLMRPPYGATNATVRQFEAARGLRETLWSTDTNDWRDRDTQLVYNRIMTSAADGKIVLLHDIHPTSVEAAMQAIRDLKAQDYQLVTVSQLYQYR